MSEWTSKKIGEIANLYQGLAINAKTKHLLVPDSSLPLLRIKDLLEGTKEQFVDPNLAPIQCRVEPHELVMTRTGQVGYVFMGNSGVLHNNCFKITVIDSEVDTKFLYWHFNSQSQREYLTTIAAGSVQPDLNHKIFKDYDVLLPSLPEQKAIASVLSSLDGKIDLLHRQNKTLEAMAETLFRQWFIEEAKEDWEEVCLGNLFTISSGKGLTRDNFDEYGSIPVLGANGQIGLTNQILFEENLIYTGRVGTLGKVSIVDGQPVWLSDNTLVFRHVKYFYFTYFHLKAVNYQDYNAGSTQPLIRQSDIKEIAIPLPSSENILFKFEHQAKELFLKIRTNQVQIQTLEQLRDTLLPKLMSGEVRVQYQTEQIT